MIRKNEIDLQNRTLSLFFFLLLQFCFGITALTMGIARGSSHITIGILE